MKIILNEKEVAEQIISSSKKYRNVDTTIDLLIKYWNNIGFNKDEIIESLDEFLSVTHKSYNRVRWANRIDGTINYHLKNNFELTDVKNVVITKSELEYIRGIDSIVTERLAFVLLVYAKILNQINSDNNNYIKNKMDEVFRCAKVTGNTDRKYGYLHQIREYGGIDRPLRVNGSSIQIDFIDEDSEVVMEITDFREFVLEYLKWRGDNIGECEVCGVRIEITNNKTVCCRECAKNKNREKTLMNYHANKS